MVARHSKGGRKRSGTSQHIGTLEADESGALFVTSSPRYFRAITPSADTDIPNGPCDGILLSAAATVTVIGAEDTTAVALPLTAGAFHALCIKRITAVSAGTVIGGWFRNPAP